MLIRDKIVVGLFFNPKVMEKQPLNKENEFESSLI